MIQPGKGGPGTRRKCPHCNKWVLLTKDGKFRKHLGLWPMEVAEHPVCDMSGEVAF